MQEAGRRSTPPDTVIPVLQVPRDLTDSASVPFATGLRQRTEFQAAVRRGRPTTFLESKAAHVGGTRHHHGDGALYTGVFRLQDDFDLALARIPGGEEPASLPRLIVTAVDLGEGLVIHCPRCNTRHPFREEWRGQDMTCPTTECGGPLETNPFIVARK